MPDIAFGQPVWVDAVLDAIEGRVALGTGLPRERVFSYAGEPDKLQLNPQAEQFVSCWVSALPVINSFVAGGGAAHTGFDSTLRLDVFVRIGLDRELTDVRLLRDKSFGFAGLVRRTIKAFQGWHGSADNATSPFVAPSRLAGVAFNPRTPPTGWAWARVTLGVKFRTDFTV